MTVLSGLMLLFGVTAMMQVGVLACRIQDKRERLERENFS